jgi:hypothetical protein
LLRPQAALHPLLSHARIDVLGLSSDGGDLPGRLDMTRSEHDQRLTDD